MKQTKADLNQPLSKRVRRASRVGSPVGRAQDDLEALLAAYREAGHISASDLKGEISMLRSVLRRVFALASVVSAALEDQEKTSAWAEAVGKMPEAVDESQASAGRGADAPGRAARRKEKKKKKGLDKMSQEPVPPELEARLPKEDPVIYSLELWVQMLESLSQGAMRLANLMRAQQALEKGKSEPEEKASESHKAISGGG